MTKHAELLIETFSTKLESTVILFRQEEAESFVIKDNCFEKFKEHASCYTILTCVDPVSMNVLDWLTECLYV